MLCGIDMSNKFCLEDMTWPEVQKRVKESQIAIVPTGSIEQHGRHLPLKTDIFCAYEIAKRAAEKVKDDVKTVVVPPIWFGLSPEHIDFPGTISLRPETLLALVEDVCKSLVRHGFNKLVIFNGHGGNPAVLQVALIKITKETGAFVALINWWDLATEVISEVKESLFCHAEEVETSVVMALGFPVNMSLAKRFIPKPRFPELAGWDLCPSEQRIVISDFWDFGDPKTANGSIGDPTKASKEKGEKILAAAVDKFAEFLRDLAKEPVSSSSS